MTPPRNLDKVLYKQVGVYGTVLESQKDRNGGSSILINGEAYIIKNPSVYMRGKISIRSWEDNTFPVVYGYGDIVGLNGILTKPRSARNPGVFDYQKFLNRQDVFATMTVKEVAEVLPLGIGGNSFFKWINNFRDNVELVIQEITPDFDTETILKGVVLGEQNDMPVELYDAFRKTSTTHILVVSGVNFAILAGWIYGAFQLLKKLLIHLGVRNPILEKRYLAYIPVFPVIVIYAFMAGAEFSVMRAFVFISIFILAVLLDRDSDLFNILAIAGLCILIFSPGAFWNVGFQMSFVAVASIAYLMPYWDSLLVKVKQRKIIYRSLQGIAVSISAQLGVGLIIAYTFGTYSFSGYIANPLITPLVVILTPIGFISCLIGLVSLPLGTLLGWLNYWIILLLKSIVIWFAGVEFLYIPVKNFSLMHIIVATAIIIVIANLSSILKKRALFDVSSDFQIYLNTVCLDRMSGVPEDLQKEFSDNRIKLSQNARILIGKSRNEWLVKDNPSDDWRDYRQAYLIKKSDGKLDVFKENQTPLMACLAIISLVFVAWATLYEGNVAKVTYLDVGEADSALVDLPGNYEILIDGGSGNTKYNAGERVVLPFLNRQGINDLELMVSTHPDNDHSGGLTYIVDNFKVDKAITGGYVLSSPTYKELVARLDSQGIEYHDATPEIIFDNGDTKVEVLSSGYKFHKNEDIWMNNNSVVLKVTYKKASFLFTGDIHKEAEQQIVNSGRNIKATVLKVPHHGSYSSSSYEFIQAVKPSVAVISVGYRNFYKHPSPYTVKRYERSGVDVYRTDQRGAITIITDGRYGWIRTMYP
jgi:ComEC/Rec2-related protein